MKEIILQQLRKKRWPLTIVWAMSAFIYLQHHWQWFS
jgi:hypothetical protein